MSGISQGQLTALAIELEVLAESAALDDFIEVEMLAACERFGSTPLMAGILLFFCSRAMPSQVERLWQGFSPSASRDFAEAIIAIHPVAAIRGLGSRVLSDILRSHCDDTLHERVARALCANAISDSEGCLAALTDSARDVLAYKLAERAGRERADLPSWIEQVPEATRRHARVGFAIGALDAQRPDRFASTVKSFDPADWRALGEMVSKNSRELGLGVFELLLSYRDRLPEDLRLPWPVVHPAVSLRSRSAKESDLVTAADIPESEQAVSIARRAATASAEELRALLIAAHKLGLPSWRREACRAILRRAAQMRTQLRGIARGLPREVVLEELVASRLARGETAVVRRSAWRRLDVSRRFALVIQTISAFRSHVVFATVDRIAQIAQAVVDMPAPLDGILAVRILEELGDRVEFTPNTLETLAAIGGGTRDSVLTAIGRSCALHSNGQRAHEFMLLAKAEAEHTLGSDTKRRLTDMLDHHREFPGDPVVTATSLLATVSDRELPGLVRICMDRLSAAASEMVLAGMIARGRGSAALAGIGV